MRESVYWDKKGRVRWAKEKRRSKVPTPNYYLVGFGDSSIFSSYEERELVFGVAGNVHPPEMHSGVYDPFPVDIYQFGMFVDTMRWVSVTVAVWCISAPSRTLTLVVVLQRAGVPQPFHR